MVTFWNMLFLEKMLLKRKILKKKSKSKIKIERYKSNHLKIDGFPGTPGAHDSTQFNLHLETLQSSPT